jgi:hypothetical protein
VNVRNRHGSAEGGQATVELALLLPVLAALLVLAFQIALLVRNELLLVEVGRQVGRAIAVDEGTTDAASALAVDRARALGMEADRLTATVEAAPGDRLRTVRLRYRQPVIVPLVAVIRPNLTLSAQLTVAKEEP